MKVLLAPCLIKDDGGCIGQVEAAIAGEHGNLQDITVVKLFEYCHGQASGLGAEQEGIIGLIFDCSITSAAFG